MVIGRGVGTARGCIFFGDKEGRRKKIHGDLVFMGKGSLDF